MEQLTGLDTMFLNLETPTSGGHVGSIAVFDIGDSTPAQLSEELRQRLVERIHLLRPYRRRLVEVPLGLDRPYWIEDPDFDLDFHIRHIAVPPPGTDAQLADLVARLHSRALDRRRALWEAYLIEGLANGNVAIYTKMHHCAIDGASGMDLTSVVFDPTPEPAVIEAPSTPWSGERKPTSGELLARTAMTAATAPAKMGRLAGRLVRSASQARKSPLVSPAQVLHDALDRTPLLHDSAAGDRLRRLLPAGSDTAAQTRSAARTSFNGSLSAHRVIAFGAVDFERIRAIKGHFGVTVNDTVMAICAGALRSWLIAKEELPTEPLLAMVPVSLRAADDKTPGNQVGGIVASLATDLDDPAHRIVASQTAMQGAKLQLDLLDPDTMALAADITAPFVASALVRIANRAGLADVTSPPVNLVISNVPGPAHPVYCGSARQVAMYPVSSLVDGLGLNITVVSYAGELQFGLIACRELVDDLDDLMAFLLTEVDALEAAMATTPSL